MARVAIPITVVKPDPTADNALIPAVGASVSVRKRADGTPATWWSSETGGTSSTAVLATDANGRVTAWVDRGAYRLDVTGTGIGGYSENFDATPGGDQTIDPPWVSTQLAPIGALHLFAGAADPSAFWLICDGRALSRTTYSVLWSVISAGHAGTTGDPAPFGNGDGSTTFNLPDLRGRTAIGAGTGPGGLSPRALGAKGGEESHTLTTAEIPPHQHVQGDMGVGPAAAAGQVGDNNDRPAVMQGNAQTSTRSSGANKTATDGGTGGSHNIMQPFVALSFVIRAL